VAQRSKPRIETAQLHRWRLLQEFNRHLARAFEDVALHPSWLDPQRRLAVADYLSLFLLGVVNPIVSSMRGLCQVSQLDKVQRQVCQRPVSAGSFSEAQHLLDPDLLKHVYEGLSAEIARRRPQKDKGLEREMQIVDSSLWYVLPRMHWAVWRQQHVTQRAVRLHVSFHLTDALPKQLSVTEGRLCERKAWEAMAQPGAFYVGDRYYGGDYQALGRLLDAGCSFAVRLRSDAGWVVQEELPVDRAGQAADVLWQAWVCLGHAGEGPRVRVLRILGQEEQLLIATNLSPEQMSAELVSHCYRQRWQVELFFRWLKHVMGTRHWMAESRAGVTVQIYLTLIAAVLLQLFSGERPNKRALELLQFMAMGWASPQEVVALLNKQRRRKSIKPTV
jgi:hypothetical protein